MTTNKATASNEDGGSLASLAPWTRALPGEGTVGEHDEEVSSTVLSLPRAQPSTTRALHHRARRPQPHEHRRYRHLVGQLGGRAVLREHIPAGSLVRLEITNMQFPADGGDYVVSAATPPQTGQSHALDDSAAITVIANTPLQRRPWAGSTSQEWVAAWNSVPFLWHVFKPNCS